MATAARQPSLPQRSSFQKGAMKIKEEIDQLIGKMQKQQHFTPKRTELEDLAEKLIHLINQHPNKGSAEEKKIKSAVEKHLKAAIIDLTEVPEMSAQMQRISFLTALKDAAKNIEMFYGA